MKRILFCFLLFGMGSHLVGAEDWLQFRGDAARSGYTSNSLSPHLFLQWECPSPVPPQPAWIGEDTRMPFDHAYQVVISDGLVFFGSSADCKLYALDAVSGKERWSFFTEGPVRFAPAIWKDRLFVAGDDGYLYCLSAKSGALLWKKRGGPVDDRILGNNRLISRWPVRGAPVIRDNILYFCAGIWPSEGIFIYALNPETGKVLWVNNSSGSLELNQPHPGARAESGVSAQGYLAVSGNSLLIPTGRATPAAFDKGDGKFRYFHLQDQGGGWGARKGAGPFITLIDDWTFVENDVFLTQTGEFLTRGIPEFALAAFPDQIVYADDQGIYAIPRKEFLVEREVLDRKGNKVNKIFLNDPSWSVPLENLQAVSLIGAGNVVVIGTRSNQVYVLDTQERSLENPIEVDGLPLGLAVAEDLLYIGTDRGTLYCLGKKQVKSPVRFESQPISISQSSLYEDAAKEIIRQTGITRGYCLDLGCGEGFLAYELAKQTQLHIIAVESDSKKALKARELLDRAGLYGSRIVVLNQDLSDTKLPNYFANLIVSGDSIRAGAEKLPEKEILRLQKPYGGVVCIGKPGEMTPVIRGPLEGAGTWTHQYCTPANTACSTDTLLKGPLGMLWFQDNDFEMPSRHGRGPAPLFEDGILYVEGLNGIRAFDAYNGTVLWEYPLPNILKAYDQEHLNGVAITGSNFCINEGRIYVRLENKCLCLDGKSGEKIAEYEAPPRQDGEIGTWGYLACEDGILYGSLFDRKYLVRWAFGKSDMSEMFSESDFFFALDINTGEKLWSYRPKHSIRNNTIAIGGGRVYLIDHPKTIVDEFDQEAAKRRGEDISDPGSGFLLAFSARDGNQVWKVSEDIYGTVLVLSIEHDVLLMTYQDTNFKLKSELGGRMTAFRASTGERLWDIKAEYERSRPIINSTTIYSQPGAWDLLTGQKKDLQLERSYGCGIMAGSTHLLAYRSATLGYYDLLADQGTINYGGIRPGCWINTIPAGGLLLVPEASNQCTCSYLIKATIALQSCVKSPFELRGYVE